VRDMLKKLFVVLFLLISSVFFLSLVHAVDISGCQDINSDYNGQTLTLTQDINNWTDNCFQLTESFAGQSLEINCNNHQVDYNATNQKLFSTNTYPIDALTFSNCDLNIGTAVTSNELFYVDTDMNTFSLLDSNVNVKAGVIFDAYTVSDFELELIFMGSNINLLTGSTGIWTNQSNYDYLTISDFNVSSAGGYVFRNTWGDLNYLYFINSNVTVTNGMFFYTHNLTDDALNLDFDYTTINVRSGTSTFLINNANYSTLTISDLNYVNTGATTSFRINSDINTFNLFNSNLDSNYGTLFYFESTDDQLDLNLSSTNILTKNSAVVFGGPGTRSYLNITDANIISNTSIIIPGGDWNYVNMFDSIIDTNAYLFECYSDSYIDLNFLGSSAEGNLIKCDANVDNLTISDLNANVGAVVYSSKDINYVNIIDSNIFGATTLYTTYTAIDPEIDINLNNTSFDSNLIISIGIESYYHPRIGVLTISDLIAPDLKLSTSFYQWSDPDLNKIILKDSSIDFKYSNYANPVDTIHTIFEFDNSNVNNIIFSGWGDYDPFADGNPLITIKNNSDINNLSLLYYWYGANSSGPFISFVDNNDYDFQIDYNNFYFNFSSSDLFTFTNSNFFGDFNVVNLDNNIDKNVFVLNNSTISRLNVTDSNIIVNTFATLDADSNIYGGSITNNLLWINNLTSIIFAPINSFNLDFNTLINEDYSKRSQLLSDDSNYVGGNLWLNLSGNLLCTVDSAIPHGICDSSFEIFGSDENYYDYAALTEYTICRDITVDNLGQTITLDQDLSGWTGSCFRLTVPADNNFITIDCGGKTIENGEEFFSTNGNDINAVNILNCNFGQNNFRYPQISYFDINSDVNYFNVLDSNFSFDGSPSYITNIFGFNNLFDTQLDINLSGDSFNITSDYVNFFDFNNSDYVFFNLTDANIWVTGPKFMNIDSSSLDYVDIIDNNVVFNSGNIINYSNTSDSDVDFNFSGTLLSNTTNFPEKLFYAEDSNFGSITVTNVDPLDVTGYYFYFLRSDLNELSNLDSNYLRLSEAYHGPYLYYSFNSRPNTSLNLSFTGTSIKIYNLYSFTFSDSNYNSITLSDLNISANVYNYPLFDFSNSDISQINIFDSDFNLTGGGGLVELSPSTTDLNLNNSHIFTNNYFSEYGLFNLSSGTGALNIFNLDLDGAQELDYSILYIATNKSNISIINSDINVYAGSLIKLKDSNSSLDLNFYDSNIDLYFANGYFGELLYSDTSNLSQVNISDLVNSECECSSNSSYYYPGYINISNSDINQITFENSDINLLNHCKLINIDNSIIDANLDVNLSGLSLDANNSNIFYVNDVNTFTISDANIYLNNSSLLYSDSNINKINVLNSYLDFNNGILGQLGSAYHKYDLNLDLNFSNTIFNAQNDFVAFNLKYGNFNIFDINLILYGNSAKVFDLSDPDYSADINKINLVNSNIDQNNGYFLSFGAQYKDYIDDLDLNIIDTNLLFSGYVSPIYLFRAKINELNISGLDLSSYDSNQSIIFGASYSYGDVNTIVIINSIINTTNPFIYYYGTSDSYWDTNFTLIFDNSDINSLSFKNLQLNETTDSNMFVFRNNSDINYISFVGNNKIKKTGSGSVFVFDNQNKDAINIDTNNLIFPEAINSNVFSFISSKYNSDFNVFNLELVTDKNFFVFDDSNLENLYFEDNNIGLPSLFNLDSNSYVNGLIYNNLFKLSNVDNSFVYAELGNLNVDFNTQVYENDAKRGLIIDDDANKVGGNLWFDSWGRNICEQDLDLDGICDLPITILGSNENYYDNLALFNGFFVSQCNTFDSSDYDKTFYLTQDINGWSGLCFSLPMTFSNHFIEINCQGHHIDANSDSLLLVVYGYGTNNRFILRDCDINYTNNSDLFSVSESLFEVLDSNIYYNSLHSSNTAFVGNYSTTINLSGSNLFIDNASYGFEFGTYDHNIIDANIFLNNSVFQYETGQKRVNIFDSNIDLNNSYLLNVYSYDSNYIDLNYSGSYVTSNGSYIIGTYDFNYNYFNIFDLNVLIRNGAFGVLSSEEQDNKINIINSNLDFNSALFSYFTISDINFFGTTFVANNNASIFAPYSFDSFIIRDLDINYTSGTFIDMVYNNDMDINNLVFVNSNLEFGNDAIFFDANSYDYYDYKEVNFDFNNSSVNRLILKDFNINYSLVNNDSIFDFYDSNINYIGFTGNNSINLYSDNFFRSNNLQQDVNIVFSGLSFNPDSTNIFNFNNSNSNLYISDLNISSGSDDLNIFVINASNIDVNANNSNILMNTGNLYYIQGLFSDLNLNMPSNLTLNLSEDAKPFVFDDANIDNLYLYNAVVDADTNIFSMNNTDVNYILIEDSNISSNSLFNISVDSNVKSGLIYNNVFYTNMSLPFVYAPLTGFNADFNSDLNLNNSSKRHVLFDDDSNVVGGNYWYNISGTSLCSSDINEPYGLCDYNQLVLGSDENYYDVLALKNFYFADLALSNISLSGTTAGTITVGCNVYNNSLADITQDYNVTLSDVNGIIASTESSTDILPGQSNTVNLSWSASVGTYNLNCIVNYDGIDVNADNNSYSRSVTITNTTTGGPTETPYNVKISSASVTGNISKTSSATLNATVSKSGTKAIPGFDLKVYVLDNGSKRQIDSKSLTQSDLTYPYSKVISLNDLLNIDSNLLNLVDSTGKVQFEFEINVSGDETITDNNRTAKTNIEYFDAEISNVKLSNSQITDGSLINFDVTKNYSFKYDVSYTSINKSGTVITSLSNTTQNKNIFANTTSLGSSSGKNVSSRTISQSINVLNLMSESNARNIISELVGGSKSENDTKVNEIMSNLSKTSMQDYILETNKILFSGLSDNFEFAIIGDDDSSNNDYSFGFDYFSTVVLDENDIIDENTIVDENKIIIIDDKKGAGGSEGTIEDINTILIPKEDVYILKYKSKLGLGESQEIYVYDINNDPRPNIALQVEGKNNSWYLSTDYSGKAVLSTNEEGTFNIYVPYPEKKVSGIFQVIANYISSSSDFVELSNLSSIGTSKTKSGSTIFLFISIIVILVVGIILFIIFKPRKKTDVYDFTKTQNYKQSSYLNTLSEKINYIHKIKSAEHGKELIENTVLSKNKENYRKEIELAHLEDRILERRLLEKTGKDNW